MVLGLIGGWTIVKRRVLLWLWLLGVVKMVVPEKFLPLVENN